jgi:hypothetical protein
MMNKKRLSPGKHMTKIDLNVILIMSGPARRLTIQAKDAF